MNLVFYEMNGATTEKNPSRQPQSVLTQEANSNFQFLFERPVGIGVLVGSAVGALNSLMFSISILASTFFGAVLGGLVCIVAYPTVRSIVKMHRQRMQAIDVTIEMRSRAGSAFTSLE